MGSAAFRELRVTDSLHTHTPKHHAPHAEAGAQEGDLGSKMSRANSVSTPGKQGVSITHASGYGGRFLTHVFITRDAPPRSDDQRDPEHSGVPGTPPRKGPPSRGLRKGAAGASPPSAFVLRNKQRTGDGRAHGCACMRVCVCMRVRACAAHVGALDLSPGGLPAAEPRSSCQLQQ